MIDSFKAQNTSWIFIFYFNTYLFLSFYNKALIHFMKSEEIKDIQKKNVVELHTIKRLYISSLFASMESYLVL